METSGRREFLKRSSLLLGTLGMASFPALATAEDDARAESFKHTILNLWRDDSPNNHVHPEYGRPRLDIYAPARNAKDKRPAIVVCPGGGYVHLAPHEGAPFAKLFATHGIVGAVLTYHVSPHRHSLPYADAARAIRILRKHAETLNIDVGKVSILGFSAGGHLASTVATQSNLYHDSNDDLANEISARPDRLMLGYPVISLQKEYGHLGSANNLLGGDADADIRRQLSNDLQVNAQTPPAFLFHTADDSVVSVLNSLRFAEACHHNKVPVALHVYPSGPHGVGMALDHPELRGWTELLMDWLGDWKI